MLNCVGKHNAVNHCTIFPLISGASSGIGAATAKLFSQLGASLALTGRKEDNLRKVGEECKRLGNREVRNLKWISTRQDNNVYMYLNVYWANYFKYNFTIMNKTECMSNA